MDAVIYRTGMYFEDEAASGGDFESMDQIELAARALERAGFLAREVDDRGRARHRVVTDITAAELAFAVSAEHKRLESGG